MDVSAGAARATTLVSQLEAAGIRTLNVGPRIRFVTSMQVDRRDCERALGVFRSLLAENPSHR